MKKRPSLNDLITKILSKGPVTSYRLYKDCEKHGYGYSDVTFAAVGLGVKEVRARGNYYCSLDKEDASI